MCIGGCCGGDGRFVFFKQKTAYEMLRSLVGSEMCIRDRASDNVVEDQVDRSRNAFFGFNGLSYALEQQVGEPVSYTHLTLPTIYSV